MLLHFNLSNVLGLNKRKSTQQGCQRLPSATCADYLGLLIIFLVRQSQKKNKKKQIHLLQGFKN